MPKSRYINTKFWSDSFIGELEQDEKLLFLYFLTNEHTNICGIYELTLRTASFESGIDVERIQEILDKKFESKVVYHHGYVIIKNFYRHQQRNAKINIGIGATIRELPPKVITKLQEIGFPVQELTQRGQDEKEAFIQRKNRPAEKQGGFRKVSE